MDKEVSEVDRKLFLRKTYLDKIYYHINRNPINQDELYSLIRKFFGEYLKLDYEFTYEELSQELNKVFVTPKVKEHIDDFLIRLSESEYLEEVVLGTSEINGYLEELGDIIKNIIYDDQPVHEAESIVQKVLGRHKEPVKVIDVASISSMIEEANFHITNGNIDIAKSSYINLLKAYDALNKEDKKRLHDDLNEVYERLQTLIKNPKSQTGLDKKTAVNYIVSDSIKKVRDSADDTLFYINASNAESAKRLYAETLSLYESLNPEDKKMLHSRISDLYNQLQAMLSVTTYIDSEPESTSDGAKNTLADGQIGPDGTSSNTAALNMDLSTLSPLSGTADMSATSKTESTSFAGNTLLGDYANTGMDASNIDISAATSNLAEANVAGEDNRLFRPNTAATENFSFVLDTTEDSKDVKKNVKEKKSTKAGPDTKTLIDLTEKTTPDAESNAGLGAGNVLFTSSTSSQGSSNVVNIPSANATFNENTNKTATKNADVIKTATPTIITRTPVITKTSTTINANPANISAVTFEASVTPKTSMTNIPRIDSAVSRTATPTTSKPLNQSIVQSTVQPEIHPAVDKLARMLRNIDDDIVLEKFDKAKATYKEALLFYRSMTNENKLKCYDNLFATFKRLDDVMHQRSLHDILDKHLSDAKDSNRPISSGPHTSSHASYASETGNHSTIESSQITKMTTLPVMLANTSEMTRIYELVEESYFNINNAHSDLAMLKYFKALELYRALPILEKKKMYPNLYELFKKLSVAKVA